MSDAARDIDPVRGEAVIHDPTGLHARPAVKLTKLAKSFDARVELRGGQNGAWINAKSPNAVMKMKAGYGETISVRASGAQADSAVAALVGLIERDFDG
jgi:phosphocarrier protein HPr